MSSRFLQQQIAATETLIVAYTAALTALGTMGATQSYRLDTSQSSQTVTRADIPRLQKMLDSLHNTLVTQEARLCGGGTRVQPSW